MVWKDKEGVLVSGDSSWWILEARDSIYVLRERIWTEAA